MNKREEVEAELAKDKELYGVLAWDRNTKHMPFMTLDDGDLIVASVNSYAKHCKDPVAAASSDLLGRALALLRDELASCAPEDRWGSETRALLAETKEEP